MSGILSNSTSALIAFQRALATISHNVANANTEGYSRQRIELSNRIGAPNGSGFAGAGVQVDTIRRLVDDFVTTRLLFSGAELGRLQELSRLSGKVDAAFTDPGTALTQSWSALFDAAQAVATDPSSIAAREAYLASAETLAARMRYLDGQLDSLEQETTARMRATAEEVTRLSREVARLNQEIVRQKGAAGGQPPNDLLDQRDRLVAELGRKIGVTTALQDDGSMNVYTQGGQALVVGTRSLRLVAQQDPFQPQRVNIAIEQGSTLVPLPDSALAGELSGLVDFRRQVLDPTNRQLGLMASALAFLHNRQNAAGVDLYGNRGGPIFAQPPVTALAAQGNTGSGSFSASILDIAQVTTQDIEMVWDGVSFTARDPVSGQTFAISGAGTPGNPYVVNGVAMVLSGTPNPGDRFLIQPTAGAAGRLTRVMQDPRGIAAAAPVLVSADLANLSDAVPQLTVSNPDDPLLGTPVDIVFVTPTSYTVNGGPAVAWTPGSVISVNGWDLRLDPPPAAGDTFRIRATGPNSSDNTNARALAQLDDALALRGGLGALNGELRALVTSVGAAAQGAEFSLQAQQAIQTQLEADRATTSGVNLDEEAANLVRFQQAYQAAAQLIGTADTLFQTLLGAVRR